MPERLSVLDATMEAPAPGEGALRRGRVERGSAPSEGKSYVKSSLSLADLEPAQKSIVLNHAEQVLNVQAVVGLLRLMDAAGRDPERLFNFQAMLFHAIYRAQLAAGDIKRARMRIARGKTPGWPAPHEADVVAYVSPPWTLRCSPDSTNPADWEIESAVAARVIRQLSDIGDGLAWRIYRHDRAQIIALADHDQTGTIVGAANRRGLEGEVGAVISTFKDRGRFALLHDLTTVLRHTDLTELHADGFRELHEVKAAATASATAKAKKQRIAAQAALNAAEGLEDLRLSDARVTRFGTQLRSHVRELESVLATAMRKGHVATRVGDRVVGAFYFPGTAGSDAGFAHAWGAFRIDVEKTSARVMPMADQRLQAPVNLQDGDRPAFVVPFSVWPLPVEQRAALICDYLYLETMVDSEVVRRALAAASGGEAFCHLATGLTPDKVFTIVGADGVRGVHGIAVRQLLAEFVTTDCFAQAFTEDVAVPESTKNLIHAFANERAVWR